jgi:hypothetical protein
MSAEKTSGSGIRRLGLAATGVAVTLAVMGGSLALALGVLGDEAPLAERAPMAAVGGGGAAPADGSDAPPSPAPRPVDTPTPAPVPVEPESSPTATQGSPTPSSAAGGLPENANASPKFLALRDVLAEEIEAYQGQVGRIEVAIAVTDLQTGETISVDGNDMHKTGCTINMFALFAAVGEFQAGRANPQSVASNIRVGIGESYPPQVYRLLANVFPSYQAGVARAQEMMRSWGMVASEFHQVPYYPTGSQMNGLTSLEVNMVLGKLHRGELYEPEWTEYTLERLRNIAGYLNYILPGRLPASATVAHKIGYFWDRDGWVNNDAGIVTFTGTDGEEKAYVITYLSQKARTEYTGYSFGARLSGIVWDWFEATYRLGTEPPPPPPPPPPPAPEPTAPPTQPTPEPRPTQEPSPNPTIEPSPTLSPTAEPTPSPTVEPSPTPSPTPEPAPSPTASPEPSPTP